MASAWGDSFGDAWGDSWGEIAEPQIPDETVSPLGITGRGGTIRIKDDLLQQSGITLDITWKINSPWKTK